MLCRLLGSRRKKERVNADEGSRDVHPQLGVSLGSDQCHPNLAAGDGLHHDRAR
jgi:hypothetical protein